MKKWFKRLLLLVACLLVLAAGASFYSYHLAHGLPAWYIKELLTPAEQQAAANQAHQKVFETVSYAGDIASARRRQLHQEHPSTIPADLIAPKTISISEREANYFFDSLDTQRTSALREKLSRFVSDARLALVNNHVVIAGTLKNAGWASDTIASIELAPSIDDQGKLRLQLVQIYSGRLPLPRSLLSTQEQKLRQTINQDLPDWQDKARMAPDGTTDRFAVEAAMAQLVLAILDDQPAEPIAFLPVDVTKPDFRNSIPVRLTDIRIADKTLTFTIRPLTDEELKQVISDIQKPSPDAGRSTGDQ